MTLDNLRQRPTPVSSLSKVQMGAITGAQLALIIALLAVLAAGGVVLTGIWPPADEPAPAARPTPIAEPPPAPVEPAPEPTTIVTPPPMPEPSQSRCQLWQRAMSLFVTPWRISPWGWRASNF